MQKIVAALVSTLSLVFSTCSPLPAVAAESPAALQQFLDKRVAGQPGTGIIVAIVDGGRTTILKAGSSGTARPLDEHTLFEIGSVTKTFTALALASMAHDGLVALDDPVGNYLPPNVHVPARDGKQITLLELATQHSGLPRMPDNIRDVGGPNPYADYGATDLYAFLDKYALTRDPGAVFEYSNLGVGLLGTALANRAGTSYETLVRTRIWKPLGMSETTITMDAARQPRFAAGHDGDGKPVHSWEFEALAGAGAIRSSAADMLRYLDCVMGRGPLGPLCLSMQTPRTTVPNGKIGLIWFIDEKTGTIEHPGDTAGFHAFLASTADHRKGVVVLTNGGFSVSDIGYAALGQNTTLAEYETAPLEPAALDAYAGTYQAENGALTFTVVREGEHLSAQLTGQPFASVYPLGNDHFYYKVAPATYRFLRSDAGTIVGLALFQSGQIVQASRLGTDGKPVGPLPASPFPPIVQLDEQTLDAKVGTFVNSDQTFVITRAGSSLSIRLNNQPPLPVFAMGQDRFFSKVVDAELEFTHDASGAVNAVILHQGGLKYAPAVRTTPPSASR